MLFQDHVKRGSDIN